VEEQFYLIWPFLLILLTRDKISPLKIIVVLMAPVLIAPIFRIFGYIRPWSILFGKHSFFTCWDSLAIGCILAVLLFSYGRQIEDVFKNRIVLPLVFGILLIVFPIIITRLRVLGFFSVPFTITFNAAGVAILIGSSLLRPNLFKFLDVKLLVSVGIGSYSIYLWQQLFCANPPLFVMPKTPWLMGFPFWVISALGVASFSYIFIEKPFLKLKPSIKTG
jgi:peptidoglycan/LPS O-acetylase OafA/YrhL